MKKKILEVLDQNPIKSWMVKRIRLPFEYRWTWDQPMSALMLTSICKPVWTKVGYGPLWARMHLQLPTIQQSFIVVLDIFFKRGAMDDEDPTALTIGKLLLPLWWSDLYQLVLAGFDSITQPELWKQLPEPLALWSPHIECHILPGLLASDWLNLEGLAYETQPIVRNPYFQANLDLTAGERIDALDHIVRDWLLRYLLDTGCFDAEDKAQALQLQTFLEEISLPSNTSRTQ